MREQADSCYPDTQLGQDCYCLLSEAVEWRLISLLLASPRDQWRSQISALAAEVRDETLQQAARAAQQESDQGMYDSTFGPGGPVSPREVSYRPASLSSGFLAELAGHYHAFRYVPPYEEPADHVALETDFVAYLKLKEAFAVCRGEPQQAAATREAAARIIAEHLAFMAEPLAEKLATSGIQYLALASAALADRTGAPSTTTVQELPVLADITSEQGWTCCSDEPSEDDSLEPF